MDITDISYLIKKGRDYQPNNSNLMLTNIKSALVSTVLMAVLVVLTNIIAAGNVFKLDWYALANAGIIALFTGFVSLLKSLLTTSSGTIAGIQIK